MPEINKRIYRIIDFYHNSCINEFAKFIGMPAANLYRLYKKNKSTQKYPIPSSNILTAIIKKHPDISGNWLLTGEGSLFVSSTDSKQTEKREEFFYSYIEKKEKEIQGMAIEVGRLTEKLKFYQ